MASNRSSDAGHLLFGRDQELRHLHEAFERASNGRGSVCLVVGEPGIGKTALCQRFALDVAEAGGRAVFGHCYEEGSLAFPYVAFVEAIEALTPDLDDEALRQDLGPAGSILARIVPALRVRAGISASDENEGDRRELVRAVSEFFRKVAQLRPLVIFLEDLHWADQDTLDLLLHLARNLEDSSLLIVGTYRDVEVARTHPFAAALAELRRNGQTERIRLRGLGRHDVLAMLAALSGADVDPASAGSIHDQTEGNPLFVREVERYFTEQGISLQGQEASLSDLGIPEGLRDVIGSRLTKLGPDCNQVLAVAAVIGRDFDFETLAECVDFPEDAVLQSLESAITAGIVEEAEQIPGSLARYRFSHALFQETLYQELSAPRRGRLHQRIARSIEERNPSSLDRHAGELAEHFARGSGQEDMTKAVYYGRLAAKRAMSVFAYGESRRLTERALEVQDALNPTDDATVCDLLLQVGDVLLAAGDLSRILDDVAPRALRLGRSLEDDGRAFAACRLALSAAISVSEPGRFWRETARLHVGNDPHARMVLSRALAMHAQQTGNFQECYKHLVEAHGLAKSVGDWDAEFGLVAQMLRFGFLRPDEEKALVDEYSLRSPDGVSSRMLASLYLDITANALQWGEREKAEGRRQLLAELANSTQNFMATDDLSWAEALFAMLDGRLTDAIEHSSRSELANRGTVPHLWRARLAAWTGDSEAIETEVRWADETGSYYGGPFRAVFYAYLGRPEETRAILADLVLDAVDKAGSGRVSLNATALLFEAAVEIQDESAARSLLPIMAAEPRGFSFPSCVLLARARGRVLRMEGRFEEAREQYLEGIAFCERIGFRPELARCHLDLADLLLSHFPAESSKAAAYLASAAAEFESMEMTPYLEGARALQASISAGQASRRPVFPDGLSQREVEVLRLLAAGRTNNQIADELVISLNTVFRHVSTIFNKTGSANRTEAANYAHNKGLT